MTFSEMIKREDVLEIDFNRICSTCARPAEHIYNLIESIPEQKVVPEREVYKLVGAILAEIDSDNRGSADYFIVDRIEEIVERWLNRDK